MLTINQLNEMREEIRSNPYLTPYEVERRLRLVDEIEYQSLKIAQKTCNDMKGITLNFEEKESL